MPVGEKIQGAIQMVQGVGDQIRGSVMDTLDTSLASISSSKATEDPAHTTPSGLSKNAELWNRGKQEYNEGRAKMKGEVLMTGRPVQFQDGDGVQPPQDDRNALQHDADTKTTAMRTDSGNGSRSAGLERERPTIESQRHFGHGDRSVGVVEGGGRVMHPEETPATHEV